MGKDNPTIAVAGKYDVKGWELRINIDSARKEMKGIAEVDFIGLGFVLMKKGALEKIQYPRFNQMYETKESGEIVYLGDDFSLCKQLKGKEVKLYVHPGVVVGHEKSIVFDGMKRIETIQKTM